MNMLGFVLLRSKCKSLWNDKTGEWLEQEPEGMRCTIHMSLSVKISGLLTFDKPLDAFLHEAFWQMLPIYSGVLLPYSPMLLPFFWVLLSAQSDNGRIHMVRSCGLRPAAPHVSQNNAWIFILDQAVLTFHIRDLKRRLPGRYKCL